MPFATLVATATTQVGTDPGGGTPFDNVVTLPSYSAGHLVTIHPVLDGAAGTFTAPAGWTAKLAPFNDGGNSVHMAGWVKVMDGSEGLTVTFQTSAAQRMAAVAFCWDKFDATNLCFMAGAGSAGTSSTPDPPNVAPGIGSQDYYAVALMGKDTVDSNATAAPSGYANLTTVTDGNPGAAAAGVAMAYADRQFTGTSEDASSFTIGESEQWVAAILLVPFGTGGPVGGGTINPATLTSIIAAVTDDLPLIYTFRNALLEDALTIFDQLVSVVSGVLSKILSDTLDVTDGAPLYMYRNRLLSDAVLVTEGATEIYTTTNLLAEETLAVADAFQRFSIFSRVLSDALTLSEDFFTSIIGYLIVSKTLTSNLDVTDSTVWYASLVRELSDQVTVTDNLQSELIRFILLSDVLTVIDAATATYVPDSGNPPQIYNPIIRIGHEQPRIDLGGYAVN